MIIGAIPQLTDYQEKYLSMERILKEKEANLLETDGENVESLRAKVADLEGKLYKALRQSPMEPCGIFSVKDAPLQQK